MLSTTPVRLWSRARQRLVETDHISFLPSKQSRLLRKRTKRNDRNWRSCRNIRKKNVKRKKQPKRKKRRTKCLGNVDFTPNSAYGISGLFFPSEIIERRGGHVETHRSLKTECPGSIFGSDKMGCLIITCLVLVAVTLPWTEGQFPRVCTTLDSLKNKECCPIPKGFTAPCGSDGNRGTCQELIIRDWNLTYSHYQPFQKDDDRHDWPHALYHRTCKCNSNFAGYDCSKCEFGYYGSYCTQKKTLTRKHFLKLSDEEKDRYMRYINMSKYFVSDYVVTLSFYKDINETVMAGRDPRALFYNVSNYDLFAWVHYYAARDTIYPHNFTRADIDFAHEGQGFPTWHRLYMLVWERTLQEIGNDEDFALPYWDWTGNAERCDPAICSEELLGVTNQTDGIVKGKYLDNWYVICTREQTNHLIEMCDPTNRKPGLKRITDKEKEDKVKEQGYVMTFPTKKEVNFVLRFATFDLPPYNKESSCNFRNIFEGFASVKTGYRLPNVNNLHNQVHIAVGGDMGDAPSASNDPIFPLHHCFVDRVYEKWLRKFNKDASILSTYDAPIGHNKDDVIVPMFPLYTHQQMFKKSFEFGYDYEDVDEHGKSSDDEKTEDVPLGQCPVSPDRKGRKGGKDADSEWKIAVTFFGGFFVGLILGIAIYDGYKRRKRRLAYNSLNGDERRNQLESNA